MKRFPFWHLKFSVLSFGKIRYFYQIFKKSRFIIFIDAPVFSTVHSDFFIFKNVTRITLKVHSIILVLTIGSLHYVNTSVSMKSL